MARKLVLMVFLMSVIGSYGQELWKKQGIKLPAVVCYASPKSYHSYVGPSGEYLNLLKSGNLKTATIEVTYIDFTSEAQQAFQFAVNIWQNLVYSPVKIRVRATLKTLGKDVLGSCSPSDYFKNFNSTQIWNCYYPVALVEKMTGEDVNSKESFDIDASFNKSNPSWYFGTDGKCPADKYDFVSTVLHELTHGLGYSGFFFTSQGRGGYGNADNYPAIFDEFVQNKTGARLVNTSLFQNPSVALYQGLTSGWLEFNTKLAETKLPRLYAPSTFDGGSSIYHLDDATYVTGDPNSLMTPFTGKGEAIHDPGPHSLAMMYDMGWKTVSIKHQNLKDVEFISPTSPITVEARIESDYNLDSTRVYLYYLSGKFTKTDSVLMKATTVPTVFKAQLPTNLIGAVRYYFSASDVKKRSFVFPSGAPGRYLGFKVGPDTDSPVITHDPIRYMVTSNLNSKISAQVTDNMGIKSVNLEYFVNGGAIKTIVLKNDSADMYSANLAFPTGSVKDGDKVSYRIVATDISSNQNIGRQPLSGYNTFNLFEIQKPVDKYLNNFNTPGLDFISSDFTITTVSGFDSPSLNSAHPYVSPDKDNTNFNFTTVLKYPIILKQGGKMSFDEIVLVEPGDPGTKFGDENFFDYVISEGSKDGGKTWKPLLDGYDSSAQQSWFNLFNSSMSGQNSTAVPTKNLFVKRTVDLLANGNFQVGDTIQIRFRLFSDPYAHGWGWMIDNLSIQDFGTGSNSFDFSPGEVAYYPNPATDQLTLSVSAKQTIQKCILKAYNSEGKLILTKDLVVEGNSFQTKIDVSGFGHGLYLFALEIEGGNSIVRKIMIK